MDSDEKVLADIYRRTSGDPIQATKLLFAAVQELARRRNSEVKVLGAGTTGSGRKLVGHVIGADLVVNEITAHLSGATHVDPAVDTIFEIGGQDSKYICARDGRIFDSNMNYVCAAGTGSFVEEQAKKLGFRLEEIGDVVMGIAPPVTSDRCTVFMEQDVDRLLRQGYTREECMAAVLCSVVKNYFNKVVGRRRVSRERIFFQGATARNKGLVAAFENLLGVEMVVSPYCHVMGSYGVALLVKRAIEGKGTPSRFKGLDLARRRIALRNERCELCANHCKITFAEIEGETEPPSWGYMCGRDPAEARVRVHREFAPFQKRLALLFRDAPAENVAQRGRQRAAAVTRRRAASNRDAHDRHPALPHHVQPLPALAHLLPGARLPASRSRSGPTRRPSGWATSLPRRTSASRSRSRRARRRNSHAAKTWTSSSCRTPSARRSTRGRRTATSARSSRRSRAWSARR